MNMSDSHIALWILGLIVIAWVTFSCGETSGGELGRTGTTDAGLFDSFVPCTEAAVKCLGRRDR